jgi:hypothetical protein
MKRAFVTFIGVGLFGLGVSLLLKFFAEPIALVVGVLLSTAGLVIAYMGVCSPMHRVDSLLDFFLWFWP